MSVRTIQLAEVASVFNGKTPSKAEQRQSGHPVLKIKDVDETGRFIGRFDSFVDPDFADNLPGKTIRAGDTLILNAAHNAEYVASKSFFAHGSAVGALATGEWLLLRPVAEHADARFVFYWSQHSETRKKLGDLVKGIHLYPKDVAELPISLPKLSEQRRIAERLERADRLRCTRRYALELSGTFLAAIFRKTFGERFSKGPFKRLGELVTITGGGTPSRERTEFFTGRIPWLTSKDMRGDYIWDTEEHVTEDAIRQSATKLVPKGSILLVVKSKVLMHRLPVAIASVALCHGQDIKSLQCSIDLHPEFARFALKYHEPHLLMIARGANTEGLTLPMLEELRIPQITPKEQGQFAAIASRHKRLSAAEREALRQADHLFQSLLHQSFVRL